ncbi:hypothetical protein BBA71_12730 [Acetobacter pasteurianus]|nr:hypothetical protein BBA71_12730 [Acetobacter pasteurianus]
MRYAYNDPLRQRFLRQKVGKGMYLHHILPLWGWAGECVKPAASHARVMDRGQAGPRTAARKG